MTVPNGSGSERTTVRRGSRTAFSASSTDWQRQPPGGYPTRRAHVVREPNRLPAAASQPADDWYELVAASGLAPSATAWGIDGSLETHRNDRSVQTQAYASSSKNAQEPRTTGCRDESGTARRETGEGDVKWDWSGESAE